MANFFFVQLRGNVTGYDMKAWWCVNFFGACLLLTSFSISTAEQRNVGSLKHDNFHRESFNVKLSDAEPKPQQHAILYKTGNKELAQAGQPFAKYTIKCSEDSDCPSSSTCGAGKVCWCSGDKGLRTTGSPKCIDLKYPCENLQFPPCHREAICLYVSNKMYFGCKCKKTFFGDGLECKKKESVKTTTTSTTTRATTPTPVTKKSDPDGVIRLFEKEAKSVYNTVLHQTLKHLTFVILGGVGFVLILLFITCCCCRRCIRKRREKRLLDSQDDESYYEQQQFSSYPAQEPHGNYYMDAHYQDVLMDDYPGPLPSILDAPPPPPPSKGFSAPPRAVAPPPVVAPPPAAAPPPPPPPPPLTAVGYQPKGHKSVSQSSFYSDDEN